MRQETIDRWPLHDTVSAYTITMATDADSGITTATINVSNNLGGPQDAGPGGPDAATEDACTPADTDGAAFDPDGAVHPPCGLDGGSADAGGPGPGFDGGSADAGFGGFGDGGPGGGGGGFGGGSRSRPFVYLDFESGKLAITDIEALDNTEWELAFRRTVIRTNSGDSGPGGVKVGRLAKTTFEAVTEVPADMVFETDNYIDDVCSAPFMDPMGNLITAFNILNLDNVSGTMSWFDHDTLGNIVPTSGHVYVIVNGLTGRSYKFEIMSYVDRVFTVRWAGL